jgi:hypothetical protein
MIAMDFDGGTGPTDSRRCDNEYANAIDSLLQRMLHFTTTSKSWKCLIDSLLHVRMLHFTTSKRMHFTTSK